MLFKKLPVLLIASLTMFLAACDDDSSSGVNEDTYNEQVSQYNDLVKKYNDLTTNGTVVDKNISSYIAGIKSLDSKMKLVSDSYFTLNSKSSCNAFTAFTANKKTALNEIIEAEEAGLLSVQTLRDNAKLVYQAETSQRAELLKVTLGISKQLTGFRSILSNMESVALSLSQESCPSAVEKNIEITARETAILQNVSQGSSNAIYRSNGSTHVQSGKDNILSYATSKGFSRDTVIQNLSMAEETNGVLGIANSSTELSDVMVDQVSVLKSKMNTNADNLELALVIDYSGSMSNNISEVISNLIKLNANFKAIKQSGRTVRIAVVTFGEPGREAIDLAFTEDLNKVDATLRNLLNRFSQSQHSIDPGEASYHGLNMAVKKLDWKSLNREIILITDEPSYEVSTGMNQMINDVKQGLAKISVNPIIVRYSY